MNAGLYVHVPFCRHRCHFCAFLITTHRDYLERWEAAVIREIEMRTTELPGPFDTIYFGGGTPSFVPPATIGRILVAAVKTLDVTDEPEVTLEANPDDLDARGLYHLRSMGVDRLSLGLQSLDEEDLRFLTRTHTAKQGIAAFKAARAAGFENITVDLLYGLPDRTRERWRDVLRRTLDLGPDHVSAYQLTYEPGTPFRRFRDTGRIDALDEEEERERFLLTRQWLQEAGYRQYEVSSFSREARFESRHNRSYWDGTPYLGVGPAAHSFVPPDRWWNIAAIRHYVAAVEEGEEPTEERETPTPEERRAERLFLGLRTVEGVPRGLLGDGPLPDRLVEEGLGEIDGDRFRLTPGGLAVADRVAAELSGFSADP